MNAPQFASKGDLAEKQVSFEQLSEHAWAYIAEGDPNCGVVIGENGVLVMDTTATPAMAKGLIERIRRVSDKPVTYVVLSHYHAVRVLGASAFNAREIIASRGTWELIRERGEADWKSEYERFPRLFANAESVPGLTWPTLVFEKSLTLWLGALEVQILQPGAGHTHGDTVVWLPTEGVLLAGDLVEYKACVYTGDAQLERWPATLDKLKALQPEKLVPGRGPALKSAEDCRLAFEFTSKFVTRLLALARRCVKEGKTLKETFADARRELDADYGGYPVYEHAIAFDVSRAYDEARGIAHPRIWTAERDLEMWRELHG